MDLEGRCEFKLDEDARPSWCERCGGTKEARQIWASFVSPPRAASAREMVELKLENITGAALDDATRIMISKTCKLGDQQYTHLHWQHSGKPLHVLPPAFWPPFVRYVRTKST
jgi:hypothetical protein